jgi:hypothetical protein
MEQFFILIVILVFAVMLGSWFIWQIIGGEEEDENKNF